MCKLLFHQFTCGHRASSLLSPCHFTFSLPSSSGAVVACHAARTKPSAKDRDIVIHIRHPCGQCEYRAWEQQWLEKIITAEKFLDIVKANAENSFPVVHEIYAWVQQLKEEFETREWKRRHETPPFKKFVTVPAKQMANRLDRVTRTSRLREEVRIEDLEKEDGIGEADDEPLVVDEEIIYDFYVPGSDGEPEIIEPFDGAMDFAAGFGDGFDGSENGAGNGEDFDRNSAEEIPARVKELRGVFDALVLGSGEDVELTPDSPFLALGKRDAGMDRELGKGKKDGVIGGFLGGGKKDREEREVPPLVNGDPAKYLIEARHEARAKMGMGMGKVSKIPGPFLRAGWEGK